MKIIRNIIWLAKNREDIEKLLTKKPEKKEKHKRYSTKGVPEFQKEYINNLLSGKYDK